MIGNKENDMMRVSLGRVKMVETMQIYIPFSQFSECAEHP